MKTDSTTYSFQYISAKAVFPKDLSASAYQFMPSQYLDKDILLSTDRLTELNNAEFRTIELPKHEGIKPFFSIERLDGVFALLLICFIFLTHVYRGGFSFFKENLPLIFTSRQKINQLSETTVTEFWYNFVLISLFVFLSSIVLFVHFVDQDSSYLPSGSFLMILLFSSVIAAFLGIKLLFYKFIGFVFDIGDKIKVWSRSYVILIEIVGLIAFLPVLLLVYSDYFHDILMWFFFSLFLLSRLIIIYRIVIFFLQENVNFLFLIAYLCSAEIIPYILIYQGLAYLFEIDILNLL